MSYEDVPIPEFARLLKERYPDHDSVRSIDAAMAELSELDAGLPNQCPYCFHMVYDLPGRDSGLRKHMDLCDRRPEGTAK